MGLGSKIRAAREAKGLDIRQLADAVGVSFATISRWETEDRIPRVENLFRLSAALDVPVSDFLSEGDTSPESIIPQ